MIFSSPIYQGIPVDDFEPGIDPKQFFEELLEQVLNFQLPELPSTEEMLNHVTEMHILTGLFCFLFGFAYLVFGLKKYKFFMMLNGAVLGVLAGGLLCTWLEMPEYLLYGIIATGAICGCLCWPLARMLVMLTGGGAGGIAGHFLYEIAFDGNAEYMTYQPVGAVVGAILVAILFLLLFKLGLVLVTTAQGSVMMMAGGLRLISESNRMYLPVRDKLLARPEVVFLVMGGLVLVGIAIQVSFFLGDQAARNKKKRETEAAAT